VEVEKREGEPLVHVSAYHGLPHDLSWLFGMEVSNQGICALKLSFSSLLLRPELQQARFNGGRHKHPSRTGLPTSASQWVFAD
jgi:hypothetical protein